MKWGILIQLITKFICNNHVWYIKTFNFAPFKFIDAALHKLCTHNKQVSCFKCLQVDLSKIQFKKFSVAARHKQNQTTSKCFWLHLCTVGFLL